MPDDIAQTGDKFSYTPTSFRLFSDISGRTENQKTSGPFSHDTLIDPRDAIDILTVSIILANIFVLQAK